MPFIFQGSLSPVRRQHLVAPKIPSNAVQWTLRWVGHSWLASKRRACRWWWSGMGEYRPLAQGPRHHQLDRVNPSGCLGFQIAVWDADSITRNQRGYGICNVFDFWSPCVHCMGIQSDIYVEHKTLKLPKCPRFQSCKPGPGTWPLWSSFLSHKWRYPYLAQRC